jgi:transcription elongation factor GreA
MGCSLGIEEPGSGACVSVDSNSRTSPPVIVPVREGRLASRLYTLPWNSADTRLRSEIAMITELRERLKEELAGLVEELTIRIPARLGEDQRLEDHRATIQEQLHIQGRIQFLHQTLSALDNVEPRMVPEDGAGFGSTVRLRDLTTGAELTYTLMTGDVIDLDAGEISLASPVGQALLGRGAGEEFAVTTPLGRRRFHIVSVSTIRDEIASRGTVLDMRYA